MRIVKRVAPLFHTVWVRWTISALCFFLIQGFAQVRRDVSISSFINPANNADARIFRDGGIAFVAGGVVFQGRAHFFLETPSGRVRLATAGLSLVAARNSVFIRRGQNLYQVEIHRGLACPLARFVNRGGSVAFTILPDHVAEAQLNSLGLVGSDAEWIAKEFATSPFQHLLFNADFAGTDDLPGNIEKQIKDSINTANRSVSTQEEGSYINIDSQVTYRVFLIPESLRAEVSGVPLRYSWSYAENNSAFVDKVEALSQDWPNGTGLAVLPTHVFAHEERVRHRFTQYDVISIFQNAALFRTFKLNSPTAFEAFMNNACQGN